MPKNYLKLHDLLSWVFDLYIYFNHLYTWDCVKISWVEKGSWMESLRNCLSKHYGFCFCNWCLEIHISGIIICSFVFINTNLIFASSFFALACFFRLICVDHVSIFHFIFLLNIIPLCNVPFCLSSHQMDVWILSSIWLLWIMVLWTFMYNINVDNDLISLGPIPRIGISGFVISLSCFLVWGKDISLFLCVSAYLVAPE